MPRENKKMLSVREISKSFGGVRALRSVSLDIYENEILGIMGPNGSGKTTLVNVITGYIRPDKGKVYFFNRDITGLPPYEISRLGVVRTFQIPRPFKNMTLLDNIALSILVSQGLQDINDAYEKASLILDKVRLGDKKHLLAKEISDIEKKRLELARALGANPKILFLDEVLAGARGDELHSLLKLINEIREEKITIVVIEHIVSALLKISDRIIVLDQGSVIAEGKPEEIINNSLVKKAYLGEA